MTASRARAHLRNLCATSGGRHVGSLGNHAAADHVERTFASLRLATRSQTFPCLDWRHGDALLTVEERSLDVQVSPYSLGCRVQGRLVTLATLDALAAADLTGAVALLHGELAQEPLTPKRFPFYQVPEHQQVIALLEAKRPLAVVALTDQNTAAAGAVSPFPLIEDGDVDIPSAYLHARDGAWLLALDGATASLAIDAWRSPGSGRNVIAEVGDVTGARVVVMAHLDAKPGTPGALDNATGVVTRMLLAERLATSRCDVASELVAMNGEDHYDNPGEVRYLRGVGADIEQVSLCVNLDGLGFREGRTAYSLYGCPPAIEAAAASAFADAARFVRGASWYQGDHAPFVMRGRPAVAVTSERMPELLSSVIHTPADSLALVDAGALVATSDALHSLLLDLGGRHKGD